MTKITWDDKIYSVGVKEIDEQHKEIFKSLNMLNDSFDKKDPLKTSEDILIRLVDYAGFHFSTEEKYFEKFNYQETERHLKKHRDFVEKIKELINDYHQGNINLDQKLNDFIEEWIKNHIQEEDKKYSKCFQENGLK